MTNDLNFKNKYFKYKLKYYKLKQLGGVFPNYQDIVPGKMYYIKNVETELYLRYSTTSKTLSLGTNENGGRKFKFIRASKENCYRIESQSTEAKKKVISYNASNQGILEENKSGVKNQVFKITKNPDKDCYKIVNCNSNLSLEIREGNIGFAVDRDNSNKQCFILEEVPTAPPAPQPPSTQPLYNPDTGMISDTILAQMPGLDTIPEEFRRDAQLVSAMVWGALNRARDRARARARDRVPGLSSIPDEVLVNYISSNTIMRQMEVNRDKACEFVRAYDGLSKNDNFVNTASILLRLEAGGGTAP